MSTILIMLLIGTMASVAVSDPSAFNNSSVKYNVTTSPLDRNALKKVIVDKKKFKAKSPQNFATATERKLVRHLYGSSNRCECNQCLQECRCGNADSSYGCRACCGGTSNCASGCPSSYKGDGECDSACNNAACNYDNGDCALKSDGASCSYGSQCSSGTCRGSNCCNYKGRSTGCTDCDSYGSCSSCSSNYYRSSSQCYACPNGKTSSSGSTSSSQCTTPKKSNGAVCSYGSQCSSGVCKSRW